MAPSMRRRGLSRTCENCRRDCFCGEWNRYGHPAQVVLDRLKAAGVKLYRTDLQGEITITQGRERDYTS